MTENFIKNALGAENLNIWTTLYGQAQRISFISDGVLTIDPKYRLFYFDTDCQMLHVLNLTGDLYETTLNAEIPSGFVKIQIQNKYYLNRISPNYMQCDLNGETDKIHLSISFDKIVGIYNQVNVPFTDIYK